MRKILSLFTTLCVSLTLFAYNAYIDGIYYYLRTSSGENTATVTYRDNNHNSYSGNIIIPNTVEYNGVTYTVTAIGSSAFQSCSDLTSVIIPSSITSMGSNAFYGCSGLTSVTIPNSVNEN